MNIEKPSKIELRTFNGLNLNKIDPTMVKDIDSVAGSNIRIDNPYGTLSNQIGMTKWNNAGTGYKIDALFQLRKHRYSFRSGLSTTDWNNTVFSVYNGTINYGMIYYPWTTLSTSGGNTFNALGGCVFDNNDKYMYTADTSNSRIVKAFLDASSWTNYGSSGSSGTGKFNSPTQIQRDTINDYVYVLDEGVDQIIKTKLDGSFTGWYRMTNPIGATTPIRTFWYEETEGYIYGICTAGGFPTTATLFRCLIDGTNLTSCTLSNLTGVRDMYYDIDNLDFYISLYADKEVLKLKWGDLSRTDISTGYPVLGCTYNSDDDVVYARCASRGLFEIDFNTSIVTEFGSVGTGTNQFGSGTSGNKLDYVDSYIYIPDTGNNRIVRTSVGVF